MKVLLFALTGFGNKVLDTLIEDSCEVKYLFCRKENGPFPYYDEEDLESYAHKKGITVNSDFCWNEVEAVIEKNHPELLLVSTFHKIIPEKIINLVPLCVNLHPSLLPKYGGPTPIDWVLYYNEKITGVTAHLISEKMDAGDILIQKTVLIEKKDNKSKLMKKMAELSTAVVKELLKQIRADTLKPVRQDLNQINYLPKFNQH